MLIVHPVTYITYTYKRMVKYGTSKLLGLEASIVTAELRDDPMRGRFTTTDPWRPVR